MESIKRNILLNPGISKNHTVEIMRFVFCILIINYHFFSRYLLLEEYPNFFARSYMGDEYFFIIAGFFLAQAAMKAEGNPVFWSINRLIGRIKKIAIPYYLTWVMCFFGGHLSSFLLGQERGNIMLDAINSVYELLFLEMFGFIKGRYSNIVGWFFSALLIVTFILGALIAKYKNQFILFFAPLFALFSYGLLSINYDYLYHPYAVIPDTFILKGTVRAFAAVNIGIFIYGIIKSGWFQVHIKEAGHNVLRTVRCLCVFLWLGIVSYMIYPFSSNSDELSIQYDYIIVILMTFALIPVLGGIWDNNRETRYVCCADSLGKYAYYAYFGQAIFYSFDQTIYIMNISVLSKAAILNFSVFIISIILWKVSIELKKPLCRVMEGSV